MRPELSIRHAILAGSTLLALTAEAYVLAWYAPDRVAARGQHQTLVHELGAGQPLTQTFQAAANGLEAVRFLVQAARPADVRIRWTLSERRESTWAIVASGMRRVTIDAGSHWHEIAFPRIDASGRRSYQLTLQQTPAASDRGADVAAVASLDNPLRNGFLAVGTEDRWGDLYFEARSKADTLAGRFELEVVPRLRRPFNQMATWIALLVMLNVLLVVLAAGCTRAGTAPAARPAILPRALSVTFTLVLAAATVVTVVIARGTDTRIDLIDELYGAQRTSPLPLHWGMAVYDATIESETRRAIYAHTPSSITWTLTVPPGARLRAALGIEPGAWPLEPGDGVQFRVSITTEERASELLSQHVNPRHVAADRRWIPIEVDLSRFTGRTVRLTLSTDPSAPGQPSNAAYDWALWGTPRIVSDD